MAEFRQRLFEMHFKFVLIFKNSCCCYYIQPIFRVSYKITSRICKTIFKLPSQVSFLTLQKKTYIYLFHLEMVKNINSFF